MPAMVSFACCLWLRASGRLCLEEAGSGTSLSLPLAQGWLSPQRCTWDAESSTALVTEVNATASVSWIRIATRMNRMIAAVVLQALALGGIAQAPQPPAPEQQLLALLNLERHHAHLAVLQ